MTALAPLVLAALSACAAAEQGTEDPRLAESRVIVQAFGGELKSELTAALTDSGPAGAVSVCKDVAPAVASRLSRQHGAKVSRTSLRVRNAANLPSEWQSAVLEQFDQRVASGEEPPFEFAELQADGRYRYMMAIPTAGVCLVCHGSDVPEDVRNQLDADYPHDRARGYAPGDIRGAFSVDWPAVDGG